MDDKKLAVLAFDVISNGGSIEQCDHLTPSQPAVVVQFIFVSVVQKTYT